MLPDETFYWDFEATAPRDSGVYQSTWQVKLDGATAGPAMTAYVIVVPKEAQEQRGKIEKLIEEWRASHGQEVEQLVRAISEILARQGGSWLQRLLESRCALLSGVLVLAGMAVAVKRSGLP